MDTHCQHNLTSEIGQYEEGMKTRRRKQSSKCNYITMSDEFFSEVRSIILQMYMVPQKSMNPANITLTHSYDEFKSK